MVHRKSLLTAQLRLAGSAIGMVFAPWPLRHSSREFPESRKVRALMVDYYPMRRFSGSRRDHDRMVTTICQECAVGCGMCAYVSEGRLVDIQGDESNPVNHGRLCSRGTSFVRDIYSPDRIPKPASRQSLRDSFDELEDWDQALDLLADRLKKIRDQHGPKSLFIECSPAAGLDFYYPAMRFAALWGTPYVFSPMDEPKGANATGIPNAPDGDCCDWIHSRCFLIVAADPASTHPIAFRWVLEAQKTGAKVIVADTRFTKTMSKADLALRIKPDTANFLGTALMKAILDAGLYEADTIRDRLAAAETWVDSFAEVPLDAAAEIAGLSLSNLKQASCLLAKTGATQIITGKRLAHSPNYGIWRTMAAAMGWTGKNGGGWYPLDSGLPRVTWATDLDDKDSARIAERFDEDSYSSTHGILESVSKGRFENLKALICSDNLLASLCVPPGIGSEDAPLTAFFGLLSNETSNLSHMLFSAQAWSEREIMSFSNDRAIQWGRKIVDPPEHAKTGLDFWMGLAQRFGWQDGFPGTSEDGNPNHEAFYAWLLKQSPVTQGCTLEVVRNSCDCGEFVHWPFDKARSQQQPSAPLIGTSEKITPTRPGAVETPSNAPDECYPLRLECSHSHSGTAIPPDNGRLNGGLVVQINPETARALGIETGDEVVLDEPARCIEARAWITRMVPRWSVYLQRGSLEERVLVRRKGQPSQEALSILGKLRS
jgi:formate dehydrogenase (coenzyme F420) alpha subunit